MKFKDTVTIFNRLKVGNSISNNKIVIEKALWFYSVSSSLLKQGIVDLNAKTIYIPRQKFSAEYITPESYERLTEGAGFFTINNGDYIGKGDIVLEEGETVQGYKNRTGKLYEIKSVSDYDMGINNHFEVIAD
jgi:hypothetical protein